MIPGRRLVSSAARAAVLACLVAAGCSKSQNVVVPAPQAVFTPDQPEPPDGSVTLQEGQPGGFLFTVRVSAKGVNDFFGAAFWLKYDTANVIFSSYDASTSFLADGGAAVDVLLDVTSSPGFVKVGIGRRQDAGGTVTGVDVTSPRDLVLIRFLASTVASASTIEFDPAHTEVRDSSQPPPGRTIPVTLAGGSVTVK